MLYLVILVQIALVVGHLDNDLAGRNSGGHTVLRQTSPHREEDIGVAQEVRPQYFVYQMIGRLEDQQVGATSDAQDMRILASRDPSRERVSVMLVNYGLPASQACVARSSDSRPSWIPVCATASTGTRD
jgi:hypothetical protein